MSLEGAFRQQGLLRPKLAGLLRVQAEALLSLGETTEAISRLEEGIADLGSYQAPNLLWRLQWLQGRALAAADRKPEALRAYNKATATVGELRKAPLGHRLDSAYLKDKIELFEAAIKLACELGANVECCRLMEGIKSRILTTTLSTRVNYPQRIESTGLFSQRFDEITRNLDGLKYKGFLEGQTDQIRQRRAELLTERDELLKRMRFSDPR